MSLRPLVSKLRPLALMESRLHGVAHWARVHRYGQQLARRMGLHPQLRECVAVFAWTHDLARFDDSGGREHALAGARYLDKVVPAAFPHLSPSQIKLIRAAIYYHSHGCAADEARHQGWFGEVRGEEIIKAIGCCWDADRLDLLRLGIEPDPNRMSTPYWDELLPLARRLNKATLRAPVR